MNLDKSTKEGILQQLNCLSKQYEELLDLFDEMEDLKQAQTAQKHTWTAFLKKDAKKPINNIRKW